tara:strand:+ start:481 stop:1092 length:612 start_codon:yes stop_codon:yes gene_type:complete
MARSRKGSKSSKGKRGRNSRSRKGSKMSCKGGRNNSLFRNYLSNLRNNLNGGSSNLFQQDGGGYSMNVNSAITNLPEVTSYSDCCQPVLVDGNLVQTSGDTALCAPNQHGGKKKSRSSKKSKNGKKTHKKSKSRKNKGKSKRKRTTSKKTKRKSKSRKKRVSQSGGMMAEYPASVSGQESDFSGDLNNRQFGCNQPAWESNCV